MRLEQTSYRFADAVLAHDQFRGARDELIQALLGLPVPLLDVPKSRKRGRRRFFMPVNQLAMNRHLEAVLGQPHGDWDVGPLVVDPTRAGGPATGLRADFKKGRLQVEVQFGNMARWYTDVFKFQLSYSLDAIDVAVLVVPKQGFANMIDENIAYYERVCRELPWAKMSLTLPILVVGIEPENYSSIRAAYEAAGAECGDEVMPFEQRLRAEPASVGD